MNVNGKTARLEYGDNFLEISGFSHSRSDAEAENPYNTFFLLRVRSGDFCGTAPCEYDIAEFRRFADEMRELYEFRRDSVILDEICYGSKVTFAADGHGHISLSGVIYGRGALHSMKFEFDADQTVLDGFIKEINELLL